jgi:acetyltransferase-like isoleucine patch superfamily enzyme
LPASADFSYASRWLPLSRPGLVQALCNQEHIDMTISQVSVHGVGEVRIGQRCAIADDVQVVFQRPAVVTIGDYCNLGQGVKIVVDGGDVHIGDWTSIHDRCLVLSGAGVRIGQHGWFGQHTVLDGTGGLRIGNGVRVGMYSQVWSHVAAGEQIEGCTLYGTRPVTLEDDVWLVGSCVVASGITIGQRAIALISSNITKSVAAHSVVAGSPAAVKDKLSFYRAVLPNERWEMLSGWLQEAKAVHKLVDVQTPAGLAFRLDQTRSTPDGGVIVFVPDEAAAACVRESLPEASICCLSTKRYVKRLTDVEQRVLKFLAGNKARFLAEDVETTV